MKKHGFLQTFSPNAELKKDNTQPKNPLDNFTIIFMGPEGSDIKVKITGTSLMDKKLWEIVFYRNEFGWRQLHFAILDYFCEKFNLVLDVETHEYYRTDNGHLFETNLVGIWTPEKKET